MNCSLISNHKSRRRATEAREYTLLRLSARRPPSTSLIWGSMMERNSSSVRRNMRGESASSLRRIVASKRSLVERSASGLTSAGFGLADKRAGLLWVSEASVDLVGGIQRCTLRLIQLNAFMM